VEVIKKTRLAAIALLVLCGMCYGRSPKVAPDLTSDTGGPVDVIVQFSSRSFEDQKDRMKRKGGRLKGEFRSLDTAVFEVDEATAASLADDPEVLYVSPDRPVYGALDYANPATGGTIARSYNWDGTGVAVAIIDSGILDHRDLFAAGSNSSNTSRVVYSQSFVPGLSSVLDQYGHGTHVAGIVAGNGNASTGRAYLKTFSGIAPNANLVNLRVLDAKGVGMPSGGEGVESRHRRSCLRRQRGPQRVEGDGWVRHHHVSREPSSRDHCRSYEGRGNYIASRRYHRQL
jgi:serine protease AprX